MTNKLTDTITGQTPLTSDDLEGLKVDVLTKGELNALESLNIQEGIKWLYGSRKMRKDPFSIASFRLVHQKLFSRIWEWAGQFRVTNKNIGVDKSLIWEQTKNTLDDAKYWIDHKTYNEREIAARLHHRLVQVHPFPNGNGRACRIYTEYICELFSYPLPIWGGIEKNLEIESDARTAYQKALKEADREYKYESLIEFM